MLYLSFLSFSLQKKKQEEKEVVPFLLYLLTRDKEEYTADAYILLHLEEIQASFREKDTQKKDCIEKQFLLNEVGSLFFLGTLSLFE